MPDTHEPLPAASQLAVLPFLAGLGGYLSSGEAVQELELTIHRAINRNGSQYLQQLTEYFPLDPHSRGKSGRVIEVDRGIVGASYGSKKIYRTRFFDSDADLSAAIDIDAGEKGKKAWLAIPFLGPADSVVMVLYSRCSTRNFFSDERVASLLAMCKGFCELYDYLSEHPFQNLRNFPLSSGNPALGGGSAYAAQEAIDLEPPSFLKLKSFNFEASAA